MSDTRAPEAKTDPAQMVTFDPRLGAADNSQPNYKAPPAKVAMLQNQTAGAPDRASIQQNPVETPVAESAGRPPMGSSRGLDDLTPYDMDAAYEVPRELLTFIEADVPFVLLEEVYLVAI